MTNPFIIEGPITYIYLMRKGEPLLCTIETIDLELVDRSIEGTWTPCGTDKKRFYAVYSTTQMHRLIMGEPHKPWVVDHINRNKLDNRRSNLRVVTYSQNGLNRRPSAVGRGYWWSPANKTFETYEGRGATRKLRRFKTEDEVKEFFAYTRQNGLGTPREEFVKNITQGY